MTFDFVIPFTSVTNYSTTPITSLSVENFQDNKTFFRTLGFSKDVDSSYTTLSNLDTFFSSENNNSLEYITIYFKTLTLVSHNDIQIIIYDFNNNVLYSKSITDLLQNVNSRVYLDNNTNYYYYFLYVKDKIILYFIQNYPFSIKIKSIDTTDERVSLYFSLPGYDVSSIQVGNIKNLPFCV
ncbi:MAG: hypothetical protein QXP88_00215 [Thermoproteota archaeon]